MIRILQQDNKFVKIVIGVFMVIVIISMVVFLVPGIYDNLGTGPGAADYATVHEPGVWGKIFGGSETVTRQEIARSVQQMAQGRQIPAFYMPMMEERAGQQLVQQKILKLEGDRRGLQVSDQDLVDVMHEGEMGQVFFPGGKFIGQDAYMNFLQTNMQMTPPQFEAFMKERIEQARLVQMITAGVTVTDNQVRDSYRVSGTKVKFDYAVISSADVAKTVNPSDGDLQTFFKQNAIRYATADPETRKIEYLSFTVDQLPGGVPHPSDADIQGYYNSHAKDYTAPEQVKTRHILITAAKDADAKTDAAAKAKAQGILDKVKAGGNFAELAKANSDDPGSKENGGELPMYPTSGLDPAYAKAAMALKPGETSGLVRSQFGYHIIQTEEKNAAGLKPLASVKDDIVKVLQQQKVGSAEQNYAAQLTDEAKKTGIDKTAAAHGLHAVTTDYLGRDGVVAGLTDGTAMMTQAFNAAKGGAPAAVSSGDGYAVYQVVDVKAPHAPTFEEYKSHLLTDYRDQQVPSLLNAQVNKLDARAKELNDLKKAAAEMNVPVKTSDLVGKDGQVPDLGSMAGPGSVAFTLAKGAVSGPINTGTDGIVLSVTDKQEPDAEDIAKNFEATRNKMLDAKREEIFDIYLGTLADKYQKAGAIKIKAQPATSLPLGS